MNSRQARISLLARINREKAVTPALLESLSEALGTPVYEAALLAPQESDSLEIDFRNGYSEATRVGASSYRQFFHPGELPLVQNLANGLAKRLGTEEVYLLTRFKGDSRAVVVNAHSVFSRVGPVIEFDKDSLSALSKDRSQGVLIDHNPDDNEQNYELTVWGDTWPLLILH